MHTIKNDQIYKTGTECMREVSAVGGMGCLAVGRER